MEDEVYVDQERISCDGGEGAEGHPKIYLEISPYKGFVICPYCSKKFILNNATTL